MASSPTALARSTTGPMASTSASTSAWVLVWPSENRSDERASSSLAPMASSTCEGWGTPAEQADPVEHSMPRASSSISSESPSQPGNVRWALPGSLLVDVAVVLGVGHDLLHPADQVVAELGHPGGVVGLVLHGQLDRGREAGDGRGVDGAGADVALLAAAVHQRGHLDLAAYDERADAVRAADLVPGQGQGVDAGARRSRRGRSPTAWTASVCTGMPCAPASSTTSATGCEGADLVVGPHHRDQGDGLRVALDRLAQRVEVEAARPVDRQQLDGRALLLAEPEQRVEHGVVLDGAGQDPHPSLVGVAPRPVEALERQVVGLGAAGGEDDLARAGSSAPGRSSPGTPPRPGGRAARRRAATRGCRSPRAARSSPRRPPGASASWRHGRGTRS